jgi:uncharacterized protein
MVPIRSKVQLVVIQPTTFCNIACKYCYLPDRANVKRMTPELVEQSYRFLLREPELLESGVRILWHAGEPLAIPRSFYELALSRWEELTPPTLKAEHWIQTNATLITQQWCDLIRRWNICVGVSIDGPGWMHDANRVDKTGRGTFERVMAGIELLRKNDIGFDVIAVLSNSSLDYADEIWNFFRSLEPRGLAFNSDEIQGVNRSSSMTEAHAEQRFEAFFSRLLELRERDASSISIRELDYFLEGIEKWKNVRLRSQEALPIAIINIGWNGDVSSFSPFLLGIKDDRYDDFVFGNVRRDTMRQILANTAFERMFRDVEAGNRKCQATCEYFGVCGGGTPSTKLAEHGTFDSSETLACRLRIKSVGNAVLRFLERQPGRTASPGTSIRERVRRISGEPDLSAMICEYTRNTLCSRLSD